jgi:hypothetical protein
MDSDRHGPDLQHRERHIHRYREYEPAGGLLSHQQPVTNEEEIGALRRMPERLS